jgi:hypothetical protein
MDGKGPFSFGVDTGASTSVIDDQVAKELNLTDRTQSQSLSGFGCTKSVYFAQVASWSIGSVPLPPAAVVVGQLRSPALPNLAGLLGSDALSAFGAVRIDYAAQTLRLGPPQYPPGSDVPGGTGPPTVAADLWSGTISRVPMRVAAGRFPLSSAGHAQSPLIEIRPTVSVSIRSVPFVFAVDTGASMTIVSSKLTRAVGLRPLPEITVTYAGLSCRVTVRIFQVSSWQVGTIGFSDQVVGNSPLPAGLDGLLGSGTLQHYNPVVVDYADGELLLGPHSTAP